MDEGGEAHYRLERALADRLRSSTREERPRLCREVYARLLEAVPSLARKDPAKRARSITAQVRALRPLVAGRWSFLDIGSGDGALCEAVAEIVPEVIGVDVVEPATTPARYRFAASNGLSIPLPDASVDVAHSSQVLEHIHPDDAPGHVREIARVLRPGGVCVCTTPNRLGGPHDVSRGYDEEATGFHLREYTTAEAVDLFAAAGFRCRALFPLRGFRPLPVPLFRAVEGMVGLMPSRARKALASGPLRRFAHMVRILATR